MDGVAMNWERIAREAMELLEELDAHEDFGAPLDNGDGGYEDVSSVNQVRSRIHGFLQWKRYCLEHLKRGSSK
jgi:hypothetical protein